MYMDVEAAIASLGVTTQDQAPGSLEKVVDLAKAALADCGDEV